MTIEKGFSAGKRRNHYFAVFGHCASLGNAWIYRLTQSGFKPSGFLMFSGGVNSADSQVMTTKTIGSRCVLIVTCRYTCTCFDLETLSGVPYVKSLL